MNICRVCVGDISGEIKTEADSNDVTMCACDDTPSVGMFAFLYEQILCILYTVFTLMFLSSYSAHQHK